MVSSTASHPRTISVEPVGDSERLQRELLYLNVGDVRSNELGGTFLNGCTGLYFMVSMDEPVELVYNGDEWEEEDNG